MYSSHLKQNLLSIVLFFSSDGMMFSSVCFGDGNVAWAVDILGRVYFITDVPMKTPLGDNCWLPFIFRLKSYVLLINGKNETALYRQ
jgi:hypothetical protein